MLSYRNRHAREMMLPHCFSQAILTQVFCRLTHRMRHTVLKVISVKLRGLADLKVDAFD